MPLAVAVRSALINLSSGIAPDLYVLDSGVAPSSRQRLAAVADAAKPGTTLNWIAVHADRLQNLQLTTRITAASFARLLIPELVPDHIRRVVYLDSDILVRRDVSPLFTIDLAGAPIGAVRDVLIDRLDLSPAMNAGVLVVDLARWREMELTGRTLRYASETGRMDQAALNAVVADWYQLDDKWNVQHGNLFFAGLHGLAERPAHDFSDSLYRRRSDMDELFRRRWSLYRNAAVLHFVGGVKPWNSLCPLPGTTSWVFTMLRTGWYPRSEGSRWLLRYIRSRVRYLLGTSKRQLYVLLSRL